MSNKVFYCQAYENTLKILNLNVSRCQKLKTYWYLYNEISKNMCYN